MEFQPTEDRLTKILELLKDIQSLSFGTQRKAQEVRVLSFKIIRTRIYFMTRPDSGGDPGKFRN